MKYFTIATLFSALCWLSAVRGGPILALNHSSQGIRQISADVFTCDSSDELLNAVCKVTLPRINSELRANGLSVNRDEFLFQFEDDSEQKIRGGCSRSAKLKRQRVSATLSRSARIDVSGDSLVEPFAIRLELPVSVSAKFDIKQRYGVKVLGSCSNYASDSFSLKGSISTTADVMIGISFNPSFGIVRSGDYALVIQPKLALLATLRNTDIKLRASGVSPFSGVLTFITGATSSVFKSFKAIFTGDSISSILEDFKVALGDAFLLGVGALPRPLEKAIFNKLLSVAEKQVEKKANGFSGDLENSLGTSLRRALKLDNEGKRVFLINRDIVSLIGSSKGGANLVFDPPPPPSSGAECQQADRICSSTTDLAVLYRDCRPAQEKCTALKREHSQMYKPSSLIISKPKISGASSSARTSTSTKSPTTSSSGEPSDPCDSSNIMGVCLACQGCRECQELSARCSRS